MIMLVLALLIQAAAVVMVGFSLRIYMARHRFSLATKSTEADSLPSVSVCIPARNETHAMSQCLERVLASDYPKLEIVVFDDDSGDDTSRIIRSFAQAGVRFVEGTGLPDGWLGKNYALDVLSREASGKYVIFMDVDTIIGRKTISQLVANATTANAAMVSVIPGRADGWRTSVLFGHLRYFWELAVSTKSHPPAASALWMIHRKTLLDELGSIAAFKLMVIPESAMASMLGYERYQYLVASPELEVHYEKKWLSQLETSRRLLFPRAGGNRYGAALALSSLVLLNVPTAVLLSGFITGWSSLHAMAAAVTFLSMAVYGTYTNAMWRKAWWMGAILWPIVVFQEMILFCSSATGYLRRTITWKGRPVTPYPKIRPLESSN